MAGHNWNRPICHAWAKSMKRPCVRKIGLRRNGSLHVVCPSHGSKTPPYSERPISAAGKARIGAAARDMWARYRQLKAAGLPTVAGRQAEEASGHAKGYSAPRNEPCVLASHEMVEHPFTGRL